jgi:hypothetical protein
MAPTVLSVTPTTAETDVVLGTQIIVIFSSLMDHTTINDGTFSLTGPGQTMIATPDQVIAEDPTSITGREYITGTFAFDDTIAGGTQTQVTFNPSKPLRPNVRYDILLMGSGGSLTADTMKDIYGVSMVGSYTWYFTTGSLNLVIPPPSAPVPGRALQIDPSTIIVIPRLGSPNPESSDRRTGADPTQEIDLIFPDSVSLSPYDPTLDILSISTVEAILGDLDVVVPSGLSVEGTWASYGGKPNRMLKITITGWPV